MKRIERLLSAMTLEEKIGQLTMLATGSAVTGPTSAAAVAEDVKAGAAGHILNLTGREAIRALQRVALEESRLGIPLVFALDVLHGYRTLFPIPLAEAGVLDPEVWMWTARAAAREAAADGLTMTFAPMLDVARDPRWGRCAEGPGEDPWLAASIAGAKIKGFQGESLADRESVAAVAKHFCAYGAAVAGRDYASADISARTLHEVYLPPFAAAVQAQVAALMPAFQDLAGEPMTAHVGLLKGWLRGRRGFAGLIVSDYHAIAELVDHGIAADLADAATLALAAGVDVDMMSDAYRVGLPQAIARGRVALADLDVPVRRVLELKERLGLFDDPYREVQAEPPDAARTREATRRRARDIATRSLVLLKNDRDVLPLAPRGVLAVIGPLADARADMRGPWWGAGEPDDPVTVLTALKTMLAPELIVHAAGVEIGAGGRTGVPAALAACAQAAAIVLCLGEAAHMSGEAASRAYLDLPGEQRFLAEAVLDFAAGRGVPVVAVLFSGRPLIVPWLTERADAVIAAWFPGCEAGSALADVLLGHASPTGRTAMTWPRAIGQIPIYFSQRPSGRPSSAERFTSRYIDVPVEPLFPFGHGLGYGRFSLSNLRASAPAMSADETIEVSVDVRHESGRADEETVFLFTHDPLASVARPLLELKGFGKIRLAPGESGTVRIPLRGADVCFPGQDLEPVFEPGELAILVGPSADRTRLLAMRIQLRASRA